MKTWLCLNYLKKLSEVNFQDIIMAHVDKNSKLYFSAVTEILGGVFISQKWSSAMTVLGSVQSFDNVSEKQVWEYEECKTKKKRYFFGLYSAPCLFVPPGCHSVSDCCSEGPLPWFRCDKKHSKDYSKIQTWEQQTPDQEGCWVWKLEAWR